MYGWCPHPPSPTLSRHCLLAPNHILLQTLSSSFSRKHPSLISSPIPGSASDTKTLHLYLFLPRLHRWLRMEAPGFTALLHICSLLPLHVALESMIFEAGAGEEECQERSGSE